MMVFVAAQGASPSEIAEAASLVRPVGDVSVALACQNLFGREILSQSCRYLDENGPLFFDSTLHASRYGFPPDETSLIGVHRYEVEYDDTLVELDARAHWRPAAGIWGSDTGDPLYTGRRGNTFADWWFGNISHFSIQTAQLQAEIEGTILSAAICEYRVANGHWPVSLNDVLPDTAPKMSRTEYYGSPFIYRIVDDWPLLYYVGDDGKDNGGRPRLGGDHWKFKDYDGILLAPPGWYTRFPPSADLP